MSRLLIKNIHTLISCDDQDTIYHHVNLYAENGVIHSIGPQSFEADQVIDGSHYFVYPGLINTHHHLYQTFTRNLPQVQNLELFDWLRTLYEIWKELTPDAIYLSSLVGMGELIKNGCTTCFDHHYVFPHFVSHNFIDKQFEAADTLGIRMHASRGSMSLSQKDGGLPPDSVVQTVDEILADCERLVKKYHNPSPYAMHQIVFAPCSPFSVTKELLRDSAKLARKLGVRLHTHLAETLDEERFTLERTGMRPLEYMASLGWIGQDVWFAHGIHFNDEELHILAQTQTGVAHCPISNMKLSSGVARIPEMLKLGVPVGLAVDGSASNDGSNLLEELRMAYLLHRLHSSSEAPTGYELLKMATKGSAKLLGRTDIGTLAPYKTCDLFMVNYEKLELVGATYDAQSALATVGLKKPVDYTIIAGKIVSQNGKLLGIDEEKISSMARMEVSQLLKKGGIK